MQGSLDFWAALAVASSNAQTTEDFFTAVDQLSLEDKAALVKHLLVSSGMNVVFNNSPPNSATLQIQSMDRAELGAILQAIGDRLKSEGVNNNGELGEA